MKKALKITAFLCLLMAVAALLSGIFAFNVTKRSFFMGYAMIGLIRSGGIMGFIGNVAVIAFTVLCYGLAGLNVLADRKRDALIWSAITSLLAIASLIMAIVSRNMNPTLGDVFVTAIPVVQLLLVIKSAD